MDERKGASGRTKLIIIAVVFALFAVAILFGMSQANNARTDIQTNREKIELVQVDGKTVLTDELLHSDYEVYVKNTNTGLNIMLFLVAGMAVFILFLFVSNLVKTIKSARDGESIVIKMIGMAFSGLFLVGCVIFLVVSGVNIKNQKPGSAAAEDLHIDQCYVINKNTETRRVGSRKHKTTHTDYYVYLDNGEKLSVSSLVYSQVTTTGEYYIGENEQGHIFCMYPASEYCLEGAESEAEDAA